MNKILQFYYKISNKQMIKIRVYVDTIEKISVKPRCIMNKNATLNLGDLLNTVAESTKIKKDNLFWYVKNHFTGNEAKLQDIIEDLDLKDECYELRMIYISDDQAANINFDIEKVLQEKYADNKAIETGLEMIEMDDMDGFQEIIANKLTCKFCNGKYLEFEMFLNVLCQHQICRNCASQCILNHSLNEFKCPQPDCSNRFCDHDIQQILNPSEYERFQNSMLKAIEENKDFIYPKTVWVCKTCTFINFPCVLFCDTCHSNRPGNYIIPKYWQRTPEEEKIMEENSRSEELAKKLEQQKLEEIKQDKMKHLISIKEMARQSVTMTCVETECPICCGDYEAGEAIVLHSCLHTICKECFKGYLINVEDAQVKCPTENCIGIVEDQEIRAILTESEYERYQEMNLRMAEAREKHSFHCKAINCTAWIIIADGLVTSFKCPSCKKVNCIPCNTIHEGMNCKQYHNSSLKAGNLQMAQEDELFIQKMFESGDAMKCPGCGILVQKSGGCDGVTCKSCGIMMCWATKGPRWGPKGKGDTTGGCGCRFFWGKRCHPSCHYCH